MPSVNVLVFIHGVVLDTGPSSHTHQYRQFYDALCRFEPPIAVDIPLSDHVAMIEWGHAPLPAATDLLDDEKITDAENAILRATKYDLIKAAAQQTPDDSFLGLRPDTPGRLLSQPFVRPIKETLITLGITDTFYYTSADGESAVRRHVYSQFLAHLEQFRASGDDVRIHIVSHSQGATIAFDFLFGLLADDQAYGGDSPGFIADGQAKDHIDADRFNYWRSRGQDGTLALGSFSSFGSQLALMMMRKQRLVNQLAAGTLLDPSVIGVKRSDTVAKWKHFYDTDDVLGYPVRHLFDCAPGTVKEFEVDSSWSPLEAHTNYWINQQVQHEIAEMIEQNL